MRWEVKSKKIDSHFLIHFFLCIFSCPEQLNRWPCHWVTEWVSGRFILEHNKSHWSELMTSHCSEQDIWNKFWQFCTNLTILDNSDHFDNFGQFGQFWTILYHFGNFDNFDTLGNPIDLWHLRHWLQFWQVKIWIHDNLYYLTIKSDPGQHSQFLRCLVFLLWNKSSSFFIGLETNLKVAWFVRPWLIWKSKFCFGVLIPGFFWFAGTGVQNLNKCLKRNFGVKLCGWVRH